MPRSAASIVSLLILMMTIPALTGDYVAADRRIRIQGRVLDENGQGLSGWPVTLIGTQRSIEFKRFSTGGEVETVESVTTDRSGYFKIDVERRRGLQYWFIRFVTPGVFDPVKYMPPEDVEITREARRGRLVEIDTTVRFHPDWPEVLDRVAASGGEDTPRGKILLTLGLPEKIVSGPPSEEEWWYFERGVVYTFRGTEEMTTRRFEPVRPVTEEGASGTEGR